MTTSRTTASPVTAIPTRVTPGLRFHMALFDGTFVFETVAPRQNRFWDCKMVAVIDPGLEIRTELEVFRAPEILKAVRQDREADARADEQADYWGQRTVGETLHYHNGFGSYVRGTVQPDAEGQLGLRPESLVGAWAAYDLPTRMASGRITEPYHVQSIREARVWRPHTSCIAEASTFVSPNGAQVIRDPRALPALVLSLPEPDRPTQQREALERARQQAVAALQASGDPTSCMLAAQQVLANALVHAGVRS